MGAEFDLQYFKLYLLTAEGEAVLSLAVFLGEAEGEADSLAVGLGVRVGAVETWTDGIGVATGAGEMYRPLNQTK